MCVNEKLLQGRSTKKIILFDLNPAFLAVVVSTVLYSVACVCVCVCVKHHLLSSTFLLLHSCNLIWFDVFTALRKKRREKKGKMYKYFYV